MELDWSEEELAFQNEIRTFIKEELTDEVKGSIFIDTPARVAFVDKLAERGWLGMGFPKEYGGSGEKPFPLAQFILTVELDRADAPIVGKNVGVIANTIFHEGSEELKNEFLPKIFKNQGQWSICYTEPGAGTDIGSMRCAAVDKGDHFEVTGSKIFITSAHFAQYHWMAVRTDPDGPKHHGISIIIVDADAPGITLSQMNCVGTTAVHRTNEVFFDKVKVPKSRLVGEVNKGFYYMMQALDYERFAITSLSQRVRRFTRIIKYLKSAEFDGDKPSQDPIVRRKFARLAARLEAGIMLERLTICAAAERVPSVEAAMVKAWGAIVGDEMAHLILEALGPFGYLAQGSDHTALDGMLVDEFLMAGHSRVAAAGVDTAKSIVAKRLLNLPNALGKPVLPGKG